MPTTRNAVAQFHAPRVGRPPVGNSKEIADGIKRSKDIVKQLALEGLRQEIDTMIPRVKQVMKQTRARIFRGDTRSEGKIFSLSGLSPSALSAGDTSR